MTDSFNRMGNNSRNIFQKWNQQNGWKQDLLHCAGYKTPWFTITLLKSCVFPDIMPTLRDGQCATLNKIVGWSFYGTPCTNINRLNEAYRRLISDILMMWKLDVSISGRISAQAEPFTFNTDIQTSTVAHFQKLSLPWIIFAFGSVASCLGLHFSAKAVTATSCWVSFGISNHLEADTRTRLSWWGQSKTYHYLWPSNEIFHRGPTGQYALLLWLKGLSKYLLEWNNWV